MYPAVQVSNRNFVESLSKKADIATLDQFQNIVKQDLADTAMAVARKADSSNVEELTGRCERLRARVEADSDTTASALRTISSTFDSTLADVRSRLEGCNGQVVALNRNMAAVEQQMREQDISHRCALLCGHCRSVADSTWRHQAYHINCPRFIKGCDHASQRTR